MKKILCCVMLLLSCSLALCSAACKQVEYGEIPPEHSSGWMAYWDWERSIAEAKRGASNRVVAFAADFDRKNHAHIREEIDLNLLKELRQAQPKQKQYLSFVNDRELKEGMVMKDLQLVRELVIDPEVRSKHIRDIVVLTKKRHFDGLEIDYENIWQDPSLLPYFNSFVEELAAACSKEGLAVRIVLEPKTLQFAEQLKADVEYVVMFYNLYGTHSGPGPKADKPFIKRTLKKLQMLPGRKTPAFALGGFRWCTNSKTIAVSEKQALALADRHGVVSGRDMNSHAMNFTYEDQGRTYTVWYADEATIQYWYQLCKEEGYEDVSIWYIGAYKGKRFF